MQKKIFVTCIAIAVILRLVMFIFPDKKEPAVQPVVEAPASIATFSTPAPEPVFVPVVDNTGSNTSEGTPLKL